MSENHLLQTLIGNNIGFGLPSPITTWVFLCQRFGRFLLNLEPTDLQLKDVATKAEGIVNCLNRNFWGCQLKDTDITTLIVGSWGKGTRARPSSDMDMIFLLPWAMHNRFSLRSGNKQSAILQEVKTALLASYPMTDIRADGPTVILDFVSYKVEIAPAFRDPNSPPAVDDINFKVWLCDTNNNGRYKICAPIAEKEKVAQSDRTLEGDPIALIRMLKAWRHVCSVPIKSFYLEQIVLEFLSQWEYTKRGLFWYDWMVRDFFSYMISRKNGFNFLPVSNEIFWYGDKWLTKAESALSAATQACIYEYKNLNAAAGNEWQKIFGTYIPKEV